jgi:hypothetical protein
MRLGRDFELLLQELALAPPARQGLRRGKQRLRHCRRDCFCVHVDEEVFLLNAEAKRAGQIRDRSRADTGLLDVSHALPCDETPMHSMRINARERHGLFRCGASAAAGVRCP